MGGDQSQHLELTGDLAHRFNTTSGPTFTVPELVPAALTARVRDLADPSKKMSKSAAQHPPGAIRMLDNADVIRLFALLDVVGNDVSLAIQRELYLEFREPGFAPAPLLEHLVTAGYRGRSCGRGFCDHS